MTAVLALSGWWRPGVRGSMFPVWRRSAEPAQWLAEMATAWTSGIAGQDWLQVGGPEAPAEALEVRPLLERALADQDERAFMRVRRSSREAERVARFVSRGHVLLAGREIGRGDTERLAELAGAVIPHAEQCDYAYVAGADPLPEQRRAERGRERLPIYYLGGRQRDQEHLPDAFAWQLVTPQHLQRAHDLSRWRVDHVARERFTLSHPDPDAWFVPDEEAGHTRPEPEVLTRARADFGALILRDD